MQVRRIVGESMVPTLKPGTIVVARKSKMLSVGDIVFARMDGREVVKRIIRITENGYFLQGDNKGASTDSRTKGLVAPTDILGKVIWPRTNQ